MANDGQSGELDKILTDVENLVGGSGADLTTGPKAANVINGGLGVDKLNGGNGTDSAQTDKSDVKTSVEKVIT